MFTSLFKKIFGTKSLREVRKLKPVIDLINSLEPEYSALSQTELIERVNKWRNAVMDGDEELDNLLPHAFAATRVASQRTIGMRHFDVQLIGGIVLHKGKISEMRTGEGKTLTATSPVFLNALTGKGVHVVTVNDYLAKRDAEWMGQIYRYLGLDVGYILAHMDSTERRNAYNADITYGTNNEFGFDYLRDNMRFSLDEYVQRGHHYAIVDEVDSILVDEARTPLIISGPTERSPERYYDVNKIIPKLVEGTDYELEEKHRQVFFTEEGINKAERDLGCGNLYDASNIELLHMLQNALKAHVIFKRDVDYVVQDGERGPEVFIVDEFTGRIMVGRRYSDGLHQALEAKEGVEINSETQTYASITLQNYFRMYQKLAGMTGTAETEASEFWEIYKLDVTVIPTNQPMVRTDFPDVIYKTKKEKWEAAAQEISECRERGQPVLVGTISVEASELLGRLLGKLGLKENVDYHVLNAKNHAREAEIVAKAGQRGAVTIATNMAGRGTDIVLGEGVRELGGLHIIGTERHESRRIDNQLRGRAGRQGDPGSSRFYLSMEDDLLRIFGGDWMKRMMETLGLEDGTPIEHRMLSRSVEKAQVKVEEHNFGIRKHVVKYDDVMNKQREVIYEQRKETLTYFLNAKEVYDQIVHLLPPAPEGPEHETPLEWNWRRIELFVEEKLGLEDWEASEDEETLAAYNRITLCQEIADRLYHQHGRPFVNNMLRDVVENTVDLFTDARYPEDWEWEDLSAHLLGSFGLEWSLPVEHHEDATRESVSDAIYTELQAMLDAKEQDLGLDVARWFFRFSLLRVMDQQWKDHLLSMEHLRDGIGLRGIGQKDPLVEYKREGFDLFMAMVDRVKEEALKIVFLTTINREASPERLAPEEEPLSYSGPAEGMPTPQGGGEGDGKQQPVRKDGRIGRNDACWCGSGKKYKVCHMKADMEKARRSMQS